MLKKILSQLNIVAQCRRYGISVWQCPQFLLLIMGLVIILTSVASYLIGTRYVDDPGIVNLVVLTISAVLFITSFIITKNFERLAEVSQMKSEFINLISHQLRSPLTNIKWTFELLTSKEFKLPSEKVEEYLNNVKENIARMVELIDDLLVFSRIEQGIFPIMKKEISLEELVKEMIVRFKVFAEASHIELNFYPEEDLPKVFADPSLMKIAVENLIDNAVRYTRGRGRVDIRLGTKNGNRSEEPTSE